MAIEARLSTYRCATCGYGATCRAQPERCPMCQGVVWQHEELRSLLDDLDPADAPILRGALDEPYSLS